MIFMSQSGLRDPSRASDWAAWYVEHLRIMLSVPGVHSAQRFITERPGYSPSLAMYSIDGPHVFEDPYYLSVRGLGEWRPLIDERHYKRNLFAGLDRAPAVDADSVLIVADRLREDAALSQLAPTWLSCAGIDRSTPLRGVAVVRASATGGTMSEGIAIYRPVTPFMTPRGTGAK